MVPRTYSQAVAEKASRYCTGKPCKHGHVAERVTNNRNCVVCAYAKIEAIRLRKMASDPDFVLYRRRKASEWKAANPEKRKAGARKWRKNNPEKVRAMHKRWRDRHPETMRASRKRFAHKRSAWLQNWIKNNPERHRLIRQACKNNYRTRKSAAGGKFGLADVLAMLSAQRGICNACPALLPPFHVDHIVAVAKGGSSDPSNLQLLCPTCNKSKGAKDMAEWLAQRH